MLILPGVRYRILFGSSNNTVSWNIGDSECTFFFFVDFEIEKFFAFLKCVAQWETNRNTTKTDLRATRVVLYTFVFRIIYGCMHSVLTVYGHTQYVLIISTEQTNIVFIRFIYPQRIYSLYSRSWALRWIRLVVKYFDSRPRPNRILFRWPLIRRIIIRRITDKRSF
jgi:hypothetical protein